MADNQVERPTRPDDYLAWQQYHEAQAEQIAQEPPPAEVAGRVSQLQGEMDQRAEALGYQELATVSAVERLVPQALQPEAMSVAKAIVDTHITERLITERAVLRAELEAWSSAKEALPAHGHMNYGRIRKINDQLRQHDAYRVGYLTERQRLAKQQAMTVAEAQAVAQRAQKAAPLLAEMAAEGDVIEQAGQRRFLSGEYKAISDWYWENKPRLQISEHLTAWANKLAKEQEGLGGQVFVNAEQNMARSFSRQLAEGRNGIDLSQTYVTSSAKEARERHRDALQNLAPVIAQARELGYAVSAGQAYANGMRQAEVLAVHDGFRAGRVA